MSATREKTALIPKAELPRIVVQRKDGLINIVIRTSGKAATMVKQMRDPRGAANKRRAAVGSAAFGERLTAAFGQAVAAAAKESRKSTENSR
jgi:hypothetical protein